MIVTNSWVNLLFSGEELLIPCKVYFSYLKDSRNEIWWTIDGKKPEDTTIDVSVNERYHGHWQGWLTLVPPPNAFWFMLIDENSNFCLSVTKISLIFKSLVALSQNRILRLAIQVPDTTWWFYLYDTRFKAVGMNILSEWKGQDLEL